MVVFMNEDFLYSSVRKSTWKIGVNGSNPFTETIGLLLKVNNIIHDEGLQTF